MSIFSRTRDIIAANVIDLLDRSDDPAKTIRVIIMEMEETLVEVRASAARCIADQKEKRRQVAQLAAHAGQLGRARRAGALQGPRGSRPAGAGREGEARRPRRGAERGGRRDRPFAARASKPTFPSCRRSCARRAAARTRSPPGSKPPRTRCGMREIYAGGRTEDAFAQFRACSSARPIMPKGRPRRCCSPPRRARSRKRSPS